MDRIVVDRITKTYVEGKGKSRKETTALRGVSFSCAEGEIFGLIGPDPLSFHERMGTQRTESARFLFNRAAYSDRKKHPDQNPHDDLDQNRHP